MRHAMPSVSCRRIQVGAVLAALALAAQVALADSAERQTGKSSTGPGASPGKQQAEKISATPKAGPQAAFFNACGGFGAAFRDPGGAPTIPDGPGSRTEVAYRDKSGQPTGSSTTYGAGKNAASVAYRDAQGRPAGSASIRAGADNRTDVTYRDKSGRPMGSSTTHATGKNTATINYRDAQGRPTGSASIRMGSDSRTDVTYRDKSGRPMGNTSTYGTGKGASSASYRDAQGRQAGFASIRESPWTSKATPPAGKPRGGLPPSQGSGKRP